jgi:hypothetical protein
MFVCFLLQSEFNDQVTGPGSEGSPKNGIWAPNRDTAGTRNEVIEQGRFRANLCVAGSWAEVGSVSIAPKRSLMLEFLGGGAFS